MDRSTERTRVLSACCRVFNDAGEPNARCPIRRGDERRRDVILLTVFTYMYSRMRKTRRNRRRRRRDDPTPVPSPSGPPLVSLDSLRLRSLAHVGRGPHEKHLLRVQHLIQELLEVALLLSRAEGARALALGVAVRLHRRALVLARAGAVIFAPRGDLQTLRLAGRLARSVGQRWERRERLGGAGGRVDGSGRSPTWTPGRCYPTGRREGSVRARGAGWPPRRSSRMERKDVRRSGTHHGDGERAGGDEARRAVAGGVDRARIRNLTGGRARHRRGDARAARAARAARHGDARGNDVGRERGEHHRRRRRSGASRGNK